MKSSHKKQLEDETSTLIKEKETIVASTTEKYEALIKKLKEDQESQIQALNQQFE